MVCCEVRTSYHGHACKSSWHTRKLPRFSGCGAPSRSRARIRWQTLIKLLLGRCPDVGLFGVLESHRFQQRLVLLSISLIPSASLYRCKQLPPVTSKGLKAEKVHYSARILRATEAGEYADRRAGARKFAHTICSSSTSAAIVFG